MSENEVAVVELPKLDFGKAIKDSVAILKENPVLLIVVGLISTFVSGAAFGLLSGPMFMGMFAICDRLVTGDAQKPQIGDVFQGFSFFVPGLVLSLFSGVGAFACGLGVLVTGPIAAIAMMRVLEKGDSIGDAIKFGFDLIFKRKQFMLIVLFLVAGVLAQLGLVLCFVGIYLTLPLAFLVPVCAYRQLFPKS